MEGIRFLDLLVFRPLTESSTWQDSIVRNSEQESSNALMDQKNAFFITISKNWAEILEIFLVMDPFNQKTEKQRVQNI